jgi:hypothetical protein
LLEGFDENVSAPKDLPVDSVARTIEDNRARFRVWGQTEQIFPGDAGDLNQPSLDKRLLGDEET